MGNFCHFVQTESDNDGCKLEKLLKTERRSIFFDFDKTNAKGLKYHVIYKETCVPLSDAHFSDRT